ncbi:MAG: hypothetical protein ABJM58_04915 [Alteripontixanthobacter sp.]
MLIHKKIEIEIDAATWRSRSEVPTSFPISGEEFDFDFAAILVLIGVLTTPPNSGGASLSEMWAFIRYLYATSGDNELRLTADYLDLDPHQKTILSDDFGMGLGMYWLANRLRLVAACDGRYFIENFLTQIGGNYHGGVAKRGPGKSPDFVAIDSQQKFHVIECKGTQSSRNYRNKQLRDSGILQKQTIELPSQLRGQSLAIGTFIAGPDGDKSQIRVVDPEPEDPLRIKNSQAVEARNAVGRGMLAKELRSSGFPSAAAAIAFPGQRKNIFDKDQYVETKEQSETRDSLGHDEVTSISGRVFQANHEKYVGQTRRILLPNPLKVDSEYFRAVEIRQGINRSRFDAVRTAKDFREIDLEGSGERERLFKFGSKRRRAWVALGANYYSDIRFLDPY